ncbi:MAG TPA: dockerin type I domain-containing protein [Thermoanaerobaculia bacterium]
MKSTQNTADLVRPRTLSTLLATLAAGALAASIADAQTLPINYQLQLQVRAATGGSAFNLPNGSTFNSASASLNDRGEVVVRPNTLGTTTNAGLFFGGHGTGTVVYNANDQAALLGDPFINQNSQVTFTRFSSSNAADDGIYVYDRATGITTKVTSGPLGATSYTNPQLNDVGILGMRAKFTTPQALLSYNRSTNAFTNYVTETAGDPSSPYSFLYAPAFNNNNRIAALANLSAQPSTYRELRIWNPNGSSSLVATGDSTAGPTFFAIDNSISMNNSDFVAFITRTTSAASSRRIVVSNGTTTTLFPTVSSGSGFTSLDSFAPVINDNGLVAFRGNDNQATPRDSVFVSDGVTVQRIAGVGDIVPTDLGPREIAFLMGGVDINNHGAVSFGVQYSSASGGGGNAIYVAYVRVVPLSAVSRKAHGAAGNFDVNLPLTGDIGIEPRQGTGTNSNNHQVVVTFAVPVTFASAAVTSGSAAVDSTSVNGNEVIINLRDVANAQRLQITLFNVNNGSNSSDVVIPMGILAGDVNGNGSVTTSDIGQVKAQAGTVGPTTFRSDIAANGTINATDISVVKARAGTALP